MKACAGWPTRLYQNNVKIVERHLAHSKLKVSTTAGEKDNIKIMSTRQCRSFFQKKKKKQSNTSNAKIRLWLTVFEISNAFLQYNTGAAATMLVVNAPGDKKKIKYQFSSSNLISFMMQIICPSQAKQFKRFNLST